MPIHYIANDPLSQKHLPMRVIEPRPPRPEDLAGFNYFAAVEEQPYPLGTPGFLFWQCREAALAALETWENLNGPLEKWSQTSKLDLVQDKGLHYNALYNRRSLSFFHSPGPPEDCCYSGASTDVVAHESGHAFLDALRQDLWDSSLFEVNAFHEAFGDCMAILTALSDRPTREALLPEILTRNFVETTAEDLSEAVRKGYPGNNAASPRRAINSYQWSPADSLPPDGGPDLLIAECHSFCQIFTGCFYQLILGLFLAHPQPDQQNLWEAGRLAGRLLIQAALKAPQQPHYFREIGRYMVLADAEMGGRNAGVIEKSFRFHGVALDLDLTLAPTGALPGPAPNLQAEAVQLDSSTRQAIRARLGDSQAKLRLSRQLIGGQNLLIASQTRLVHLGDLDPRLHNVMAAAPINTTIGEQRGRAMLLGPQPDPADLEAEVHTYVRSLLANHEIDFDRRVWHPDGAISRELPADSTPTHVVENVEGTPMLRRKCFCCGRS